MTNSLLILAKVQVSHHLSWRLPYYLTPDEVHRLIEAADAALYDSKRSGKNTVRIAP